MKIIQVSSLLLTAAGGASAAPLAVAEVKRDTPVDFAKDIYPLFKRSCLACHNTTKAKAGLNLESPQMILKGGDSGPAAVAGKADVSQLLITAAHRDDPAMPPPGNKVNATDFSPEELGLMKLWIDQGMKDGAVVENVSDWRSFPVQSSPVAAAALSAGGRVAAAAELSEPVYSGTPFVRPVSALPCPCAASPRCAAHCSAAVRDACCAAEICAPSAATCKPGGVNGICSVLTCAASGSAVSIVGAGEAWSF